jgi:hypothetical protein
MDLCVYQGARLSGKTFSGLLGNHRRLWGRRLVWDILDITLPNQHTHTNPNTNQNSARRVSN